MTLEALISEYALAEAALRKSLEDQTAPRKRVNLLRLAADRLQVIEDYEPTSRQEARDKVYFFMMRAVTRPGISVDGRDINLVLTLTGHPDLGYRTVFSDDARDSREPAPSEGMGRDLIRFVTAARERVSLFDEDLHYIATSRPNAAIYGTRPVRMIGLHISDMIGYDEFARSAQRHFDAARLGEPQEYYYDRPSEKGTRRWRCGIKPIDIAGKRKVFLVFHRDVTREIDLRDGSLMSTKTS